MKLTLDTKSLVEAITWVTKNFDGKDSTAYVALIVNTDGSGRMFHANSSSFMSSPVQVLSSEISEDEATDDEVALALEGRYVQRLAGALSGSTDPLKLTYDSSKDHLSLKNSTSKFTVPTLDTKVAKEPEIIPLGEVDDREYFDSLQRLAKLCDPANAGYMPVLGTVDIQLKADDSALVMMATDRYALGEIKIALDPTDEATEYIEERDGESILLPFENATLIPPSKGLTSSTTLVHEPRGKKFGYKFGDSRVALFSLKDAQALAYLTLKESASKNIKNSLELNVAELRSAISTVSNLAWDEEEIYFDISEDGLVVGDKHRNNKITVAVDDLNLDEDQSIKFVRAVINEAFSPVSTERMNLRWTNGNMPMVLEPLLDDGTVQDNVFVFVMTST